MKKADQFSAIMGGVRELEATVAGQARKFAPLAKKLSKLESAVERLALAVGENKAAVAADDDDWRRLRTHPHKCAISGWSRTTICRHAAAGLVRTRTVYGIRYYAGADVRRMISKQPQPTPESA